MQQHNVRMWGSPNPEAGDHPDQHQAMCSCGWSVGPRQWREGVEAAIKVHLVKASGALPQEVKVPR